jgi:hypothetical protein
METRDLSFDSVKSLIAQREVDLVLQTPPPPYALCLRACFDGHGDFFSILVSDVEYAEIPGGLTLGDMRMLPGAESALSLSTKWAEFRGVVSGPALILRTADTASWEDAKPSHLFLVVANRIVFRAGADWHRVRPRS